MKKIILILFICFCFLVGCNQENIKEDYQKVISDALKSIELPVETKIDLQLPKSVSINNYEVMFTWSSSSESINSDGIIIRGEEDEYVILTCHASIGEYEVTTDYTIKVLKKDVVIDYDSLVSKSITDISFPPYVDKDIEFVTNKLIDGYEVRFSWTTSDLNVIDKNGKVTRKDGDTEVNISCIISIGEYETEKSFGSVIVLDKNTKEYTSELLLFNQNSNYIELLNCPITKISENFQVFFDNDGVMVDATIDDLMIGLTDLRVICKNEEVIKIVIPYDFTFTNIRVAIRNSINDIADESTLYHDTIMLKILNTTNIKTYDNKESYVLNPGVVSIDIIDNKIRVKISNALSYSFDKRILIEKTSSEIEIQNITRGGSLSYAGSMDISIINGRLLLINEVDVEEYLRKVVPSEMPSSWSKEALKAQAVAARTYAYCEYYNKKYLDSGYVVDDSTSSQVYNNQRTTQETDVAVSETKGLVMFYGTLPIVAYYYSSSCGLTANGNEVWMYEGIVDEIPYLIGKNLSTNLDGSDIVVDTKSEESMLNFFKQIKFINPGGSASYHRWKITYSKEQLRKTINANIQNMSNTYPTSYPQFIDGSWQVASFPSDIGNITNVYVSSRGASGVVVSLTVETDKLVFKIINQYNIRFTIRGRDAGSTVTLNYGNSSNDGYSRSSNNPSILNSGFFALEWSGDLLTFYGGGNGHGVGMDQYGANYYAKNGKTFQDILNTYYSNIEFKQIYTK